MAKESKDTKGFTLDMSKAISFEPLAKGVPYLLGVSKWKYGQSANGPKIDVEFTVMRPEDKGIKGRKVAESVSLMNEYTLGRFKTWVKVLTGAKDDDFTASYKPPSEEDMMGLQMGAWLGVRESAQFGDRNTVARVFPVAQYDEVAEKAAA